MSLSNEWVYPRLTVWCCSSFTTETGYPVNKCPHHIWMTLWFSANSTEIVEVYTCTVVHSLAEKLSLSPSFDACRSDSVEEPMGCLSYLYWWLDVQGSAWSYMILSFSDWFVWVVAFEALKAVLNWLCGKCITCRNLSFNDVTGLLLKLASRWSLVKKKALLHKCNSL